MLNRVDSVNFSPRNYSVSTNQVQKTKNNASNPVSFSAAPNYSADKIAAAYKGYNNINFASTLSFTGSGLAAVFNDFSQAMVTCKDKEAGSEGEEVGQRANVSDMASSVREDLPNKDDAIKANILVLKDKGASTITDARSQLKKAKGNNIVFQMVVRPPRDKKDDSHRTHFVQQVLEFETTPPIYGYNGSVVDGAEEKAYVLNTKGKLMSVIEDGDDVLLTNAGSISKKDDSKGTMTVEANEYNIKSKDGSKLDPKELVRLNSSESVRREEDIANLTATKNKFKPFKVQNVPAVTKKSGGSQGGGTEIVIGLEKGRFVPEIIDSIQTFCDKVDNGEIVLDEFVPAKNAQSMQLSMLAGGFGSRAEYANASASKIMHAKEDGSDLTKGCFRTATGLTPMETSFISLHKAGLLDCSKGNLGIGKNIKFYLNDSGQNRGNGGFSVNMYDTMEREGRDSLLILPNDAMSRIPKALSETTALMNTGKAAVVMIAKEVDKEDARGSLGIMKIDDEGKIEAFAEKPKVFEEGYVDKNGKCFANTFQFAVSKEAFEALSIVEPYLPPVELGKESRDWSKVFTPVLMGITQNDNLEDMQKQIKNSLDAVKEFKGKGYGEIPLEVLQEAKDVLGNQQIYAVKTNEPWADCGTLNALYHTTMQIASGDFPLEDFERKHVIDSIDTKTGLVASTPEQKKRIEDKWNIEGQVMVVPKAKTVSKDTVEKSAHAVVRYSDKQ
ncbi:MAG: hypothetical protein LUE64_05945 [Candidatus Gastranaerophilales bacterium]|nr:hypothetical protein [Candidatus Gastranaerophilales bacterium]